MNPIARRVVAGIAVGTALSGVLVFAADDVKVVCTSGIKGSRICVVTEGDEDSVWECKKNRDKKTWNCKQLPPVAARTEEEEAAVVTAVRDAYARASKVQTKPQKQ